MKTSFGWAIAVMGTVSAFAFLQAVAAGLGDPGREQAVTEPHRPTADDSERYGSPTGDMPYDREIRLHSDTKSVSVRRLEIIKFVTADGREFLWRFDTIRPGVFPLARIAPKGVSVPSSTTVYVSTEIPIAP